MSRGVKVAAALAVSVVGVVVFYGGTASSSNQSKIESRVLRDTAGGREASFVINLKEQADLSAAYGMKNQVLAAGTSTGRSRSEAARTQAPIKAMLRLARHRLPVVLGRERDHGHGRPLARQCSRCSRPT